VANKQTQPASTAKRSDPGQINEVIELVKSYAKQETLGPLKNIGRKIGMGLAGAFSVGAALFFISLGLLRLMQTRVSSINHGAWSWVPYVIVSTICVLVTVFALKRISKIEKELN